MTEDAWNEAVEHARRIIEDGATWSDALKEFADWIGGNTP